MMLEKNQTATFAARFPQLAGDNTWMKALGARAASGSFRPGQTICDEGDSCSHLALVLSGTARVYKLAESGREITLYRIEAGECCILTASCMLSERLFPATAVVETGLQAILVPQSLVTEWMHEYAAWRHFLWGLLAERLGDVISLVEEVAFRRMDQRLAHYLAQHAEEHGPVLLVTHQQIAAELGTSREVISRMLKDFECDQLLRLGRGRIELRDPLALRRFPALRD